LGAAVGVISEEKERRVRIYGIFSSIWELDISFNTGRLLLN